VSATIATRFDNCRGVMQGATYQALDKIFQASPPCRRK